MSRIVVGSYLNESDAMQQVRNLIKDGYPSDSLSVIGNHLYLSEMKAIRLKEEQMDVEKETVQAGRAVLHKRVVEGTKEVSETLRKGQASSGGGPLPSL